MNQNIIFSTLQKEQLFLDKKNLAVERFLDIDFFNSRKSRIAENIKSENEFKKINGIYINKFKQVNSK